MVIRRTLPPLAKLSLTQKIGQMLVVRASGHLFDHQRKYPVWEATNGQLRTWLEDLNVGGVILWGGSSAEIAYRTQQLQSWSPIPLLVAADLEEGVGQRFAGATWFPPPFALSLMAKSSGLDLASRYALKMGTITAKESLAIGINWLLAPVVDVNNNPLNPVINVRAFGEEPHVVAQLATAFLRGAGQLPVLTTAKHFPGHGDTSCDSHLELPVLPHELARLEEVELLPFREAIAAGVDSIMTAHLSIPVWDKVYPATLSHRILTGELRQNLGFPGLIVTDALIMAGVADFASPEEVAILAVEAGADVLLMPPEPERVIIALTKAVRTGRISQRRIEQSIVRIWRAKTKLGPPVSYDLTEHLALPPAQQTVMEILQLSLQQGGDFPLKPAESGMNVVVVDDLLRCPFLNPQSPALTIPEQLGYTTLLLDRRNLVLARDLGHHHTCLLQLFVRGNPWRGESGLKETDLDLYRQWLTLKWVQGLVIYGSPYVLDWFLPLLPINLPWVFSPGQMNQAQQICLEKLFNFS